MGKVGCRCGRCRPTLGAQARQSNATPHIHSSHLACGYAYTPPAKLPGEGGLSLHRSSESWRAGKCDRPCESDGTSDAVASSARTCVEAASRATTARDHPASIETFHGSRGCSIKAPTSYPTVTRAVPNRSSGVCGVQRPTEGALNGWIEEVGDGKLGALGIGSICGQSRVGGQSRIHQRTSTLRQEINSKPQSGGNRKAERDALLNTPITRVFRRQQRLR